MIKESECPEIGELVQNPAERSPWKVVDRYRNKATGLVMLRISRDGMDRVSGLDALELYPVVGDRVVVLGDVYLEWWRQRIANTPNRWQRREMEERLDRLRYDATSYSGIYRIEKIGRGDRCSCSAGELVQEFPIQCLAVYERVKNAGHKRSQNQSISIA